MEKKKSFTPLLYLTSIVFLPWQFKTFLKDIKEKSILEQFIEVEELFLLDEMIKEYPKTHLQKLRIGTHKETI
uniref:Uncharacterized protein n=1 Tax=Gossypium raimondii TaxID=29730 RepID=A0A0D2R1D3_GOSRA|nr:hypothetical protein B456_004G088500 [Gossypium raimondii]